MMDKERSGLFCRRIRYDGAWETVYFLESGGGLWLPEPRCGPGGFSRGGVWRRGRCAPSR